MKIKENLTVREAEDYAKENGYNKVAFSLKINDKYVVSGKYLDAYYDLIEIPVLGSGFTRFTDLCKEHGERSLSIDIIDEEELKNSISFDFIIRGKFDSIPEEYKIAE